MVAGAESWMVTSSSIHRKQKENRKWTKAIILPNLPPTLVHTSSSKASPPKSSITFPNNSANQKPNIETLEPCRTFLT